MRSGASNGIQHTPSEKRLSFVWCSPIFFYPDYTVGFGITPNPDLDLCQVLRFHARGLYRQSGISPCPEDASIKLSKTYLYRFIGNQFFHRDAGL